jgi:dihydroorotase
MHSRAMAGSVLLRQVRILDPGLGWDQLGDLWLEQGRIREVGFPLGDPPSGIPVVAGRGWVVGPGLVDLHVHSGTPGYEHREPLERLARAALAGGFTRVGILPTTNPVMDHAGAVGMWQQAYAFPVPLWLPWGAYSLGASGSRLSPLLELAQAGVVGFGEGTPLAELGLVRRLLEYGQACQKPVLFWPQWPSLVQGGVMHEGSWSRRLGLPGIPSCAETTAVAALRELAAATTTPVHLIRLSQKQSLDLLSGSRITASTTWMHLLLTDEEIALSTYDANLRLHAPLGTVADRDALRQAVASGSLAISTDHCPYSWEEKQVGFVEAPPGAIGLELALPLLWDALVTPGILSATALWSALSTQPARILGLEPPTLKPGSPAELVIFAPDHPWVVESLYSGATNTPWYGRKIRGKVMATCRGQQIWPNLTVPL